MNFRPQTLILSSILATSTHSPFGIINISFETHDTFLASIDALQHIQNISLLLSHIHGNDQGEMILYLELLPFVSLKKLL